MQKTIQIYRGKVQVSNNDILQASIGTCVCVCLFHSQKKIGGITHISRSIIEDSTPSLKHVKFGEYFYAKNAIKKLLKLIKQSDHLIKTEELSLVLVGGFKNEGPILETINELGLKTINNSAEPTLRSNFESKYRFKLKGFDINQEVHRTVSFDPIKKTITVLRSIPVSKKIQDRPQLQEKIKIFAI